MLSTAFCFQSQQNNLKVLLILMCFDRQRYQNQVVQTRIVKEYRAVMKKELNVKKDWYECVLTYLIWESFALVI